MRKAEAYQIEHLDSKQTQHINFTPSASGIKRKLKKIP